MSTDANLVSILIRTLNRPVTLAKAVDSALQQTHRPLEVVIVNDGGEAPDPELESLANEHQVQLNVVNLEVNQGRSNAANVALKEAQGEALLFLDDDDWIDPDHISKLLPVLQENAELIAVYSDTACVFSATKPEILKVFDYEFDPQRLAYESYLPIHSVLFKNNKISQACQFDTRLDMYEDWNFWVQLVAKGQMQRVPGVTAWYSAQLSGMGIGLEPQDHSAELAKFFRLTTPFYTDKQINALLFMCWNFFGLEQSKKHNEGLLSELQLELANSRQREQQQQQQQQQQLANNQQREQEHAIIKEELDSLRKSLADITQLLQEKKGMAALYEKIKHKSFTFFSLLADGNLQGIKVHLFKNIKNVLKRIKIIK
ncbi:glycosyltransferase family 2 protein [Oceanospirillum linum]|uniref:glycosyltransferase family 2 protein n=1 Tax=Oceanospirillum linum TaxID=966 RepID=UPI00089E3C40|nr:glycosyltransferase family A protein [Oceanospirillum linum]SEG51367.1 Glycosyl transferase family 2 [Oleiphilus messinensis]SMP35527.1 Glycosyl transferase family 2 [Oceanospirillum linum]